MQFLAIVFPVVIATITKRLAPCVAPVAMTVITPAPRPPLTVREIHH